MKQYIYLIGLLFINAFDVFAQSTLRIDTSQKYGIINPLLFGVNHRWVSNGAGSCDSITGLTYPEVVRQIKDVGISMIRYPAGTFGNLFQWEKAIGPQDKRGLQISGLLLMPVAQKSTFGPDEYGTLLDQTGATGNLMINCATATAADAANFVAYMTSPLGSPSVNGVDWATLRASNGHPNPYLIEFIEIGNEYEPAIQALIDQNYWIKGDAVGQTFTSNAEKISHLYAFGGSTKFIQQPVVQPTDWSKHTSLSSGLPNQLVYARYAPVAALSDTIYVNGIVWKSVADLQKQNATDRVYSINYKTGEIKFGDNIHGAIPPIHSTIAISYISGHHEGFIDFYKAIKHVNPNVKVIASIHDEHFIKMMDSTFLYDGIQQHPYVIANPKKLNADNFTDYYVQTAMATITLGDQVQHTQDLIKKYAGKRSDSIGMFLSEYGQLGTYPDFATHFARSQAQAILQAICIREWIEQHVQTAERTVLTDYTYQPIPADLAAVQFSDSKTAGDFAIIAGPGPNTVVSTVGMSMKILKDHLYPMCLVSNIQNNQKITYNQKFMDALLPIVSIDSTGTISIIIINTHPTEDIKLDVNLLNYKYKQTAQVSYLNTENLLDENTLESPNKVSIKYIDISFKKNITYIFPKHSITCIIIHPKK